MAEIEQSRRQRDLRLLVVGGAWPPETFLMRLFDGLTDHGVQITLATSNKPDKSWSRSPRRDWAPAGAWRGPMVTRICRLGWRAGAALMRSPDDIRRLASARTDPSTTKSGLRGWYRILPLAGRRPDVIYFPWNSAANAYLPLFDLGCPVVVSCRGSQVNVLPNLSNGGIMCNQLRVTFARAAAVHCVSDAICSEATRHGLDPAKAHVIRPAVDPAVFQPRQHSTLPRPFTIVTTGSLIWRKGYEYSLMAVRRLVDQSVPVRFEIIGDGPERQRVLFTIHDLGLQHHVQLHGRLLPQAVRDLLQQADAFLLSSLSEGISNAVLEAMACGLPVVTTNCGGMPEAVEDGVEGFLVPPRDDRAAAAALQTLAADPQRQKEMGRRARQRIIEQFSLHDHVRQWLKLLREVAQQDTFSIAQPAISA